MKITSDRNDPEYRPWNDPTVRGLSEADFPDEQQIIIDALVAALEAYDFYAGLPADRGGKNGPKGMAFAGFIAEKQAALALARGEG